MPIELPDDLVIATCRIEEGHRRPEIERCATAVDGIEMPIDRAVLVKAEARVSEEVEIAVENPVGSETRGLRGMRKGAANSVHDRSALGGGYDEPVVVQKRVREKSVGVLPAVGRHRPAQRGRGARRQNS